MLRIAESAMLDCGLIFAAPKFNQTTQGSDHLNFSHLIGSTAAFKCLNYHKKSARKSINYYVFQREFFPLISSVKHFAFGIPI